MRQPLPIERRKLALAVVELIDQIEAVSGQVSVTRENTRYLPYRCEIRTKEGFRAFYGDTAEAAVRAAFAELMG